LNRLWKVLAFRVTTRGCLRYAKQHTDLCQTSEPKLHHRTLLHGTIVHKNDNIVIILSRGHVREHGAGWAVVLEMDRDPRTGRRRQRWVSGFGSKREAERAIPRILVELQSEDRTGSPTRETTASYLRHWLGTLPDRGLRTTTIDGYRTSVEHHLVPSLGTTQLRRLTTDQLDDCYAALLARGKRDGTGLSPRTVRLAHSVIRKALGDAVRRGLLDTNVAINAQPPRAKAPPDMTVWTPSDLGRFLELVQNHPLGVLFHVLAMTGMRRGEGLGLRWRDVDFENRRLSIVQQAVRTRSGTSISAPKTRRGRRSIAVDRATLKLLEQHLNRTRVAATRSGDPELVFSQSDGSPIAPHFVSKSFVAVVNTSGLPRIRLHDLRHTHASLALRAGVHVKVVSERLGHASVSMTLEVYSHVTPALSAEAAEQIASLVPRSKA
jgi:integrase